MILGINDLQVTPILSSKFCATELAFPLWRSTSKYIFKLVAMAGIADLRSEKLYFFYLQVSPLLPTKL